MNLFTQLKSDWHATGPADLLDCPTIVLKGIDEPQAEALQKVFQITSVREMVNHPEIDWVWRTFSAYRAGLQRDLPADAGEHVEADWLERSCGEWLSSPVNTLKALTTEDGLLLGSALQWVTVRNLANDTAFAAAREIHRSATGGPVPPEQAFEKSLESYFDGGTHRYMNRLREEAGVPQRPPPPPPPPPPMEAPRAAPVQSTAPAAAQPATASPPLQAGAPEQTAAPEPEGTPEQQAAPAAAAQPEASWMHKAGFVPGRHKDYAPDGSYIPRGGGSRGWFEHSLVAKTERPNRYRYHEAVDTLGFRSSALEETVRAENRGAERKEMKMQVRYGLDDRRAPLPGLCLDISLTGAKIRIGHDLKSDTAVQVSFVRRDDIIGTEQQFLSLQGTVMWCKSVNLRFRSPRYDCGIEFTEMAIDNKERLSKVLTDRVDELLADSPLDAEELTEVLQ